MISLLTTLLSQVYGRGHSTRSGRAVLRFGRRARTLGELLSPPRLRRARSLVRRDRSGFTLIGLLIVLLIIGILFWNQNKATPSGLTQAQVSIEKSTDAACLANRAAFQTNIQMYQINYSGEPLTLEAMAARGYHSPGCPDGGTWTIMPDGSIHCSTHAVRNQQILAPGSQQAAPVNVNQSSPAGAAPNALGALDRVRGTLNNLPQP